MKHNDALSFYHSLSPAKLLEKYESPLYVYNEMILRERAKTMRELVKHPKFHVYFSTKANGNPFLLSILREEGLRADAMSLGELALVKRAGFCKEEIGYVCNNVTAEELTKATDAAHWVSVDSLSQLATLGACRPKCRVMVRVNPGIGAGHHAKVITAGATTKFGVSPSQFPEMLEILKKYKMELYGLNQHIGSLFLNCEAFLEAVQWLLQTAENFPTLQAIDFGGGFGVPYNKEIEQHLDLALLGQKLTKSINDWCIKTGYAGQFFIEPGRYVVAESGRLLGKVQAVKENGVKIFVGTDIGFSVFMRPVLYDAYHAIYVHQQKELHGEIEQTLVGNICESGDVLAHNRLLPKMQEGDIVEVADTGAYGMSMGSNYNQRLRPAEVLLRENGEDKCIRKRDTLETLFQPYTGLFTE